MRHNRAIRGRSAQQDCRDNAQILKQTYSSFCNPQQNSRMQTVGTRGGGREGKKRKHESRKSFPGKVNIVRRRCPDTFVVRTFGTKRVSKQVKKCQDTVFTISCSPSTAPGFDLSLLYIPQCHKHNAPSRSFKGPSVTGSGGKRSNIHF